MALREAGKDVHFLVLAVQACGRYGLLLSALQAARGPRRVLMWKSVRFATVFLRRGKQAAALKPAASAGLFSPFPLIAFFV